MKINLNDFQASAGMCHALHFTALHCTAMHYRPFPCELLCSVCDFHIRQLLQLETLAACLSCTSSYILYSILCEEFFVSFYA